LKRSLPIANKTNGRPSTLLQLITNHDIQGRVIFRLPDVPVQRMVGSKTLAAYLLSISTRRLRRHFPRRSDSAPSNQMDIGAARLRPSPAPRPCQDHNQIGAGCFRDELPMFSQACVRMGYTPTERQCVDESRPILRLQRDSSCLALTAFDGQLCIPCRTRKVERLGSLARIIREA